jgi:hypothetical protein
VRDASSIGRLWREPMSPPTQLRSYVHLAVDLLRIIRIGGPNIEMGEF